MDGLDYRAIQLGQRRKLAETDRLFPNWDNQSATQGCQLESFYTLCCRIVELFTGASCRRRPVLLQQANGETVLGLWKLARPC